MASPNPYRRLARPLVGLVARTSLWDGGDHLLLVSSTGYSETYSRYALRDIRAIVVTASSRRLVWTWIWTGLGALSLILGVLQWYGDGVPIVFGVLLALAAIAASINALLGPTCNTYLNTKLGYVKLPLFRGRKARRIIVGLEPRIAAAQADLLVEKPVEPPLAAPPLT